jgi:peptide/nickel transport system substrate-binding protein
VRQAVSLAINRQFLARQETQGIGIPWGNWISAENRDALRGDGKDLPVPEYDPAKAKQLLAQAGFPNGFDFDWYVPFVPYFDMGERVLTDLRAVGIRSKLQMLDAPAYMAQVSQGRKSYAGNRTIVQTIDPRPGGAKASIRLYAVCGGPASFICEPQIEALWAKHQASIDPAERERLVKEIQRIVVEQLPEGEAVHRYWNTLHELPDSLGDRLPRRACREVRQFLDCFAHRDLRVCRSRLTLILWRDERQLLDPEDEDDEGE